MQFSEYNPLAFHSISSLYDANLNFQAKHGLTTVETDLKSIIFKHGVQALFGVGLVHRHFDLEKGTILVEKDMVTAPWRAETSLKKHGGKIMPTSWLLWGGQIYPYEFQFLPYSKVPPPQLMDYALFVKEFFDVVKQRGLEQWVGLRRLSGEEAIGMVECTEGNVNIMFSSNEVSYLCSY